MHLTNDIRLCQIHIHASSFVCISFNALLAAHVARLDPHFVAEASRARSLAQSTFHLGLSLAEPYWNDGGNWQYFQGVDTIFLLDGYAGTARLELILSWQEGGISNNQLRRQHQKSLETMKPDGRRTVLAWDSSCSTIRAKKTTCSFWTAFLHIKPLIDIYTSWNKSTLIPFSSRDGPSTSGIHKTTLVCNKTYVESAWTLYENHFPHRKTRTGWFPLGIHNSTRHARCKSTCWRGSMGNCNCRLAPTIMTAEGQEGRNHHYIYADLMFISSIVVRLFCNAPTLTLLRRKELKSSQNRTTKTDSVHRTQKDDSAKLWKLWRCARQAELDTFECAGKTLNRRHTTIPTSS